MKLTLNQIREITSGIERIEETDGLIRFYRFTEEQEDLYKRRSLDFYKKTFSTAGVKLSFFTNSEKLYLKGNVFWGSSRSYYSIDIFVNQKMIGCIDNFSEDEMKGNYTGNICSLDDFSKEFILGKGEKSVVIYLPWSVGIGLQDIIIDDNSFLQPVKYSKKLLAFGDSITQGYDALRPSNRYISLLAEKIQSEELNKAIGGEVFFPELAKTEEAFMPDYITVAYGTNDWNTKEKAEFKKNCKEFYEALSQKFSTSNIFAITPIWRKDGQEERKMGDFMYIEEYIKEVVTNLKNVTYISGYDFVPENEVFFADLRLHPNDNGFQKQFTRLYDKIKNHLWFLKNSLNNRKKCI